MSTEYPQLFHFGMTRNDANTVINKTTSETISGLEKWIDMGEHAFGHPIRPGRYIVEVCWEHAGQIACRTYRVRAHTEKYAALKSCAIAKIQVPSSVTHIEVVDIQPLWRKALIKEEL